MIRTKSIKKIQNHQKQLPPASNLTSQKKNESISFSKEMAKEKTHPVEANVIVKNVNSNENKEDSDDDDSFHLTISDGEEDGTGTKGTGYSPVTSDEEPNDNLDIGRYSSIQSADVDTSKEVNIPIGLKNSTGLKNTATFKGVVVPERQIQSTDPNPNIPAVLSVILDVLKANVNVSCSMDAKLDLIAKQITSGIPASTAASVELDYDKISKIEKILPLKDEGVFSLFEEEIKKRGEVYNDVFKYLQSVSSNKGKTLVKDIMKTVIGHELGACYSAFGRVAKKNFSTTETFKLVQKLVRKADPNFKINEITTAISDWLKYCPHRGPKQQ